MNNLQRLKTEAHFWSPNIYGVWNEISGSKYENLHQDKAINALLNDLKIIKHLRINGSFDGNDISNYNICIYALVIDKNYDSAIAMTKNTIEKYKNIKYYYERASKFLKMTGNLHADLVAIKSLEAVRNFLREERGTEEEAIFILPSNFKY